MDFSKQTVPQLKALCRELKITGYSKLSKPLLNQKLTDYYASKNPRAPQQTPDLPSVNLDAHASVSTTAVEDTIGIPAGLNLSTPASLARPSPINTSTNKKRSSLETTSRGVAKKSKKAAPSPSFNSVPSASGSQTVRQSVAEPSAANIALDGIDIAQPFPDQATVFNDVPTSSSSATVAEGSKKSSSKRKRKDPVSLKPSPAKKAKTATSTHVSESDLALCNQPDPPLAAKVVAKQKPNAVAGKKNVVAPQNTLDVVPSRSVQPMNKTMMLPPPLPGNPSSTHESSLKSAHTSSGKSTDVIPNKTPSKSSNFTAATTKSMLDKSLASAALSIASSTLPRSTSSVHAVVQMYGVTSSQNFLSPSPRNTLFRPYEIAMTPNAATTTTLPPPARKRFKPLVVTRPPQSTTSTQAQPSSSSSEIPHRVITPNKVNLEPYLEFPAALPIPLLSPIRFPPKVSQRKHVPRWSIVLSLLEDNEIRACVCVSRMIRYSVYLSAVPLLQRKFSGRRLSLIQERYSQNMTNMWPYLRYREHEVQTRQVQYNKSFLPKAFAALGSTTKTSLISDKLWASPDDSNQAVIAARFVLTRLWFLVSLGSGMSNSDPLAWSREIVIDAQEAIKGEVWRITTTHSVTGKEEVYHVLESTCEVVGKEMVFASPTQFSITHQRPPPHLPPAITTVPMRADWSAYISSRTNPESSGAPTSGCLLDHLKWTNHEEYDHGISRIFLRRLAKENEQIRDEKRKLAERYVLACVVSNSVSGQWLSSAQMEREFREGSSDLLPPPPTRKPPRVNLFLPAHHHVESVHFTITRRDGATNQLHHALAVVQTPSREYLVLKDNGMQVGCEEDGVGSVWMELLQCENNGTPMSSG